MYNLKWRFRAEDRRRRSIICVHWKRITGNRLQFFFWGLLFGRATLLKRWIWIWNSPRARWCRHQPRGRPRALRHRLRNRERGPPVEEEGGRGDGGEDLPDLIITDLPDLWRWWRKEWRRFHRTVFSFDQVGEKKRGEKRKWNYTYIGVLVGNFHPTPRGGME